MKKIIVSFCIIFIIIGALLFPLKTIYKDGGTEVYSAVLYKKILWNKNILIQGETKKYENTNLILFPNNFKNLEEYWKKEKKSLDNIKIDKNKPKGETGNIEKKEETKKIEGKPQEKIEKPKEDISKQNPKQEDGKINDSIKKEDKEKDEQKENKGKPKKTKTEGKTQEKIEKPKKDISKQNLKQKDGKKYVALTFDDGPHKTFTPKLLDILKKHNIKATFFVLGQRVHSYPDILKREYAEGHEIGNHSWNHPDFTKLTIKNQKKEILDTDNEIRKHISAETKYFRPPYGAFNKQVQKNVGKTILMWNVDSKDWKYRNVKTNMKHVNKDIKNGSIILFHDIHKSSIDTIDPLINNLQRRGYTFVTVSELLKMGQNKDFSHKACYGEFDCR